MIPCQIKIYNSSKVVFEYDKTKVRNYLNYWRLSLAERLFNKDLEWEQVLYSSDPNNREIVPNVCNEVLKIARFFKDMIHRKIRRKLSMRVKSEINKPVEELQRAMTPQRNIFKKIQAKIRGNELKKIENIALFKKRF